MVKRLLAALPLLLGACDQFTDIKGDAVAALARPLVLVHRGAGSNSTLYRENTLPALVYGASVSDGAEMDLQLSADGTIWLGHDNEAYDCSGASPLDPTGGTQIGCFQELPDAALDAVSYCDSATQAPCVDRAAPSCIQHYARLDDVFARFSTDPTLAQKLLALDVKDQLCNSLGLSESRTMANALGPLVSLHHMSWRLLVESDQPTFMRQFRDNGTQTYLFVEGYGEVDPIISDAGQEGADGISYKYLLAPFDPAFADGLRNVGMRTISWPVPQPVDNVADIPRVWAARPDVILTDRPDFFSYVAVPAPF